MNALTQPVFTGYEVTLSRSVDLQAVRTAIFAWWLGAKLTTVECQIGHYTHTITVTDGIGTLMFIHVSTDDQRLIRIVSTGDSDTVMNVSHWIDTAFAGRYHLSRAVINLKSTVAGAYGAITEKLDAFMSDLGMMQTVKESGEYPVLEYRKRTTRPSVVINVRGPENKRTCTVEVDVNSKDPYVKRSLAGLDPMEILSRVGVVNVVLGEEIRGYVAHPLPLINVSYTDPSAKPHPIISMAVSYHRHLKDAAAGNWEEFGPLLRDILAELDEGSAPNSMNDWIADFMSAK